MTTADCTAASPPEITAGGIYDIVSKITPFAFDGMDVAISASFAEFLEKITFALEYTDENQTARDAAPFLAVIGVHKELLAFRLAGARDTARVSRTETRVPLDGIQMDPTWPSFVISAGPYNPEDDTDEFDEDEDER